VAVEAEHAAPRLTLTGGFLHPDVAVVVSAGGVRLAGQEELATDRASVVSFVLVRGDGGWRIAAFQNTRRQPR
jgi:uncharacterized protein (TIGR02246 family)